MKNIHIRPAKLKDAAPLTAFCKKTFIDAFAKMNNKKDFDAYVSKAFTIGKIESEIQDPNALFFIASFKDQWIGYAKLYHSRPPDCVTEDPAIELARLYSLQTFLGHGVGAALVDACVDHAQKNGFHAIWLGSWKKNLRGNAFYQKTGFTICGSQTFTLGSDVQQDYVFARNLA